MERERSRRARPTAKEERCWVFMFEQQQEGREGRGGSRGCYMEDETGEAGARSFARSFVRVAHGLVSGRDCGGHTRRGGGHTGSALPAVTGAGPSNLTCSLRDVWLRLVTAHTLHAEEPLHRLAQAGIGWHWLAGTGWHWLALAGTVRHWPLQHWL